jgi:fructose-1,6-bisphosphatase/inositol monophosphatase family enzyme
VIELPALGETYSASLGQGAFLNGKKISVSDKSKISDSMGSALNWASDSLDPRSIIVRKIIADSEYGYGFMDAFTYGLVASGRLDYSLNLFDKPWDCSAAACIVTEAGGTYSNFSGETDTRTGGIILSNGKIHQEILSYFK